MKIKNLAFVFVVVTAVTFGFSFWGCSKTEGDKLTKETEKLIVIQIGDQKIDSAVLEKYIKNRPVQMNSEKAGETLRKRVDELVSEELLYQEALRLKLDQAPDTRQRIREILNQKISEELINKIVMQRKIEQPELQAYYDTHQEEFNRPAEIRVADIFIAVPNDASDDQRTNLKQKAETVLAEALASTNRGAGFLQLVRKYSDQPEKYAKGDTGFFGADGNPGGIDPRIAEAAFKLEKNGDILNAVIEAADGYHIIMQNGKRAAISRPFDRVARHLERRIKNEELQKRRDEFVQTLKGKTKVVIDEKAVAQVQEKLKTESKIKPMTPANRNLPPMLESGIQGPPIMGGGNSPPLIPDGSLPQPPHVRKPMDKAIKAPTLPIEP